MINEIREKAVVKPGGRIEITAPDIPEGTEVEVLIWSDTGDETDETEYLLSSEANREHLLRVIRDAEENPGRKVYIDLDELKKDLLAS